MSERPCKFCGKQITMASTPEGYRPRNLDGSMHKCDRGQSKPVKPQNTNEHQEFENQKAFFSPAMENEVRRIVKEEVKGFLQWMASQAEGQA